MSQESRTPRIHIKRRVELSSLQNEPSFVYNESESSETSKKSVDISSLKEKYNIRLPRSYKEQTSAPQTVHFSEELESTIPETVDELKTENQKLKKEIAELKRQNSQIEIDFEEKLEKSQENINQMKDEIDFLANINQQFGAENNQLIKNLDRFRKYRIPESISIRSSPDNSGTESEIIPSKRPKGRKLKSKKIAKTNKGKRVFGNDSEEDTESDDEKNEKDARVSNSVSITGRKFIKTTPIGSVVNGRGHGHWTGQNLDVRVRVPISFNLGIDEEIGNFCRLSLSPRTNQKRKSVNYRNRWIIETDEENRKL
ncbi:hypothetical protein Glove_167g23 [Diversispora epigaea]|uniref:Uncharacterized protein n=1 Tax=Diversispora epigaea TaxID=1348612 RepID=A0A397IQB2_9GLOM|nr:hypothetical protein Glove_167g23 [Diversispora epigaea]